MQLCKRLQLNDNHCSVFTIDYSVNCLPFCRTNVGIFMFLCSCKQSSDFLPPWCWVHYCSACAIFCAIWLSRWVTQRYTDRLALTKARSVHWGRLSISKKWKGRREQWAVCCAGLHFWKRNRSVFRFVAFFATELMCNILFGRAVQILLFWLNIGLGRSVTKKPVIRIQISSDCSVI